MTRLKNKDKAASSPSKSPEKDPNSGDKNKAADDVRNFDAF